MGFYGLKLGRATGKLLVSEKRWAPCALARFGLTWPKFWRPFSFAGTTWCICVTSFPTWLATCMTTERWHGTHEPSVWTVSGKRMAKELKSKMKRRMSRTSKHRPVALCPWNPWSPSWREWWGGPMISRCASCQGIRLQGNHWTLGPRMTTWRASSVTSPRSMPWTSPPPRRMPMKLASHMLTAWRWSNRRCRTRQTMRSSWTSTSRPLRKTKPSKSRSTSCPGSPLSSTTWPTTCQAKSQSRAWQRRARERCASTLQSFSVMSDMTHFFPRHVFIMIFWVSCLTCLTWIMVDMHGIIPCVRHPQTTN